MHVPSPAQLRSILLYTVLITHAAIIALPCLWIFLNAFKSARELATSPWSLPPVWRFGNFVQAWTTSRIPAYFLNTAFVILIVLVVGVGSASGIAFVLSRFRFTGRMLLYFFFISGLMIPLHAVVIPIYDMAIRLGTLNSLVFLGLVYSAFYLPLAVLILTSFMSEIPREIEESATVDGCSTWGLYWRVAMPLTRDGLISVTILTSLYAWNELLLALVLISKPERKTIAVGLRTFFAENYVEPTLMLAGCILALIPIMLLYAVLQERVIKGMTVGALRG